MSKRASDEEQSVAATGLAATVTATGSGRSGSSDSAASSVLARGSAIGRYTILQVLGEGGMGVVYAAYDPDLDRKVALKLLRPRSDGGVASEAARLRLLREARAMAKLTHPNVITVYEVGTVGERDFVAMEFVDGLDLSRWLAAEERGWRDVLDLFLQAGRGLAAAHHAGLVHRDFKPANVLVRGDGVALVTDFGLARSKGSEEVETSIETPRVADSADLTQTGAILGSPAYMSPEQHTGAEADERSDQFSFCVALYEALCGERPFAGRTLEEIRTAVLSGAVAEPKGVEIPTRVRRAIVRGLGLTPDARFPTMDALLAELGKSSGRRRRSLAIASLAVAGLGLGTAAVLLAGSEREPVPCMDGESKLQGVWSAERRAELERAFAGAGSFAGFARIVDRYVDDWSTTYQSACAATYIDHAQDETDYLLTFDCLLKRRRALDSMLDVFAKADASGLDNAAMAASSLPPIAACGDVEGLRNEVSLPTDPDTRDKVGVVRASLEKAEALTAALRMGEAQSLVDAALVAARQTGYSPVLAEALIAKAEASREDKIAASALEEAVLAAEVSGHEGARAKALVMLFETRARMSSDVAELEALARRARAGVERYGRDDSLLGRIAAQRAQIAAGRGDFAAGLEGYREALAIFQRVLGPGDLKVAEVYFGLAEVAIQRGQWSVALAAIDDGLAISRRHFADDHPKVILAREARARVLGVNGDYDGARAVFLETAPFWASERGDKLVRDALGANALGGPERDLRGIVVDADGQPVAGAEVVAATFILADGKYLDRRQGGTLEARRRVRRARTDEHGAFTLSAPSGEPLFVAAEHGDRGRSILPVQPQVGKDGESSGLRLQLSPFGSVDGTIEGADAQVDVQLAVNLMPRYGTSVGLPAVQVIVAGGRFHLERMPAGDYKLAVGRANQAAGAEVIHRDISIRPGEVTRVAMAAPASGRRVEVVVELPDGKRPTTSQVFIVEGDIDLDNAGEDADRKLRAKSGFRVAFTNRDEAAVFTSVPDGEYSVCVAPLAGDIADAEFVESIQDRRKEIPMYCQHASIGPGTPIPLKVPVPRAYQAPD